MAGESVFYKAPIPSLDSIDPNVALQIQHREELFSKSYINPDFTHTYLMGNSSWVRLSSGVTVEGFEKRAEEFQLLGGTLDKEGKKRQSYDFVDPFLDDAGVTTSQKAYTTQNEGVVPMPGIMSFEVQNRGNSGFTREAHITVRCYSRDHLAVMEQLYMRPGFKVLAEWGHAVYLDQNKKEVISPKYIDRDTLFKGTAIDPSTIKEKGAELIAQSGHNYDFMLGFVKNYEWTYRDGYYELQISLLGEGAATVFVKSMYGLGGHEVSEEQAATGFEFGEDEISNSTFLQVFEKLASAIPKGKKESGAVKLVQVDSSEVDKALKSVKKTVDPVLEELKESQLQVYKLPFETSNEKTVSFQYIQLKFILGLVNNLYIPKKNGTPTEKREGRFLTESGRCKYLTFEDHFSNDITVCLLPKQTDKFKLDTQALPGTRDTLEGEILDIWVNCSYVRNLYKDIMDKKENTSIEFFLHSLMKGIQTALGGINEFELYNDYYLNAELGPSLIVDRQALPNPSTAEKNYTILTPIGKKSFVRSFEISSELSTSMINLITAQAILTGQSASTMTEQSMSRFNSGIKNRWTEGSADEPMTSPNEYDKKVGDVEAKLIKSLEALYSDKNFDSKLIENIQSAAAYLAPIRLNEAMVNKNGKQKGPARGHIGAKVSMELLGIGGLKNLQYFKLPDEILPETYSKGINVGFQISNVSHSFSNNLWYTKIEARAIILKQTS